jgi:cytochrome c553
MRLKTAPLLLAALLVLPACTPKPPAAVEAPGPDLAWAYIGGKKVNLPDFPPGPQQVPGSTKIYTDADLKNERSPPDWFPDEHPKAPDIVGSDVKGKPYPCAMCHQIEGQGFLTTPNLAGLPKDYIVQQIQEFRSGQRRSWPADRGPTDDMVKEAKAVSDADVALAAAYFSSLPRPTLFRVVETDTVPAVTGDLYGFYDLVPGGKPEPIGGRIVEVPDDVMRAIRGDPHTVFIAYVPKGSVARGEQIVRTGGAAGLACRSCHGPNLAGGGGIPPIAGRSPGYIARALWDIHTGARGGPAVAQMQATAKGLSQAEVRDAAAYLASLKP